MKPRKIDFERSELFWIDWGYMTTNMTVTIFGEFFPIDRLSLDLIILKYENIWSTLLMLWVKKLCQLNQLYFATNIYFSTRRHGNCVKPYDPHTIGQSYYHKNMWFPLWLWISLWSPNQWLQNILLRLRKNPLTLFNPALTLMWFTIHR